MRLLDAFSPPKGASPARVRRAGARNALLGLLLAVSGAALIFALDRLGKGALLAAPSGDALALHAPRSIVQRLRFVAGLPMLFGWLVVATGLYRAITGVHPERDRRDLAGTAARLSIVTLVVAVLMTAIAIALVRFAQ